MTISPVQSVSQPTTSSVQTTSSPSGSTTNAATLPTVNFNQFLQLLITELQNQDPTQPTDPTQYISQLASFSAVGQQIQTNTILGTMLTSQGLGQAESLIGQQITSADGKTSGTVASVNLTSAGAINALLTNGGTVNLSNGSSVATTAPLTDGSQFSLPVGVAID